MRAAFAEPAIGNRQFGLREILARVVSIDERIQRQTRRFIVAVLDVLDGPVEQHFVRLQSVLRDRGLILLVPEKTKARKQEKGKHAHGYNEQLIASLHQSP